VISKTDDIEKILPVFKTYLEKMHPFYNISNVNAWKDKAVKNLQTAGKTKKPVIYTLKHSNTITGFIMVNKHLRFNREGLAVAELFVREDDRRKGAGTRLAEHVFEQFPGHWEIAVTRTNKDALIFWKQVISAYTSGQFSEKKDAGKMSGIVFSNR